MYKTYLFIMYTMFCLQVCLKDKKGCQMVVSHLMSAENRTSKMSDKATSFLNH